MDHLCFAKMQKNEPERACAQRNNSGSAHARVLFRFHVSLRAGLQEELVEVEPEQQLRQVR